MRNHTPKRLPMPPDTARLNCHGAASERPLNSPPDRAPIHHALDDARTARSKAHPRIWVTCSFIVRDSGTISLSGATFSLMPAMS